MLKKLKYLLRGKVYCKNLMGFLATPDYNEIDEVLKTYKCNIISIEKLEKSGMRIYEYAVPIRNYFKLRNTKVTCKI